MSPFLQSGGNGNNDMHQGLGCEQQKLILVNVRGHKVGKSFEDEEVACRFSENMKKQNQAALEIYELGIKSWSYRILKFLPLF